MRAVLDTNVLISGLLWKGAHHHCLLAAEGGLYTLLSAEQILLELYEKLVGKFDNTPEEANETITGLRAVAALVPLTGKHGWVIADPDDDKFVDAALAGNANVIVSGDHHPLDLQCVEAIPILSPREFLDCLADDSPTGPRR
jgi:putative PIN family toxin of toxin-antitoxin system